MIKGSKVSRHLGGGAGVVQACPVRASGWEEGLSKIGHGGAKRKGAAKIRDGGGIVEGY